MRNFILATAIILSWSGAPSYAQVTVPVHIFDFDFSVNPPPGAIEIPTIRVGDTIRWLFDEGLHSTTSAAGQLETWDSGVHLPPFTFDHTFMNVGTFNYFCSVHGFDAGGGMAAGMASSIIVMDIPEPSSLILLAGGGVSVALRLWRPRRRRRIG